ncbi:MAG: hypothetical protein WC677_08390 [Clostridia bacterium]|jgi:hypothetical protein
MLENDKNKQSEKNESCENEAKLKENAGKQFSEKLYLSIELCLEVALRHEDLEEIKVLTELIKAIDPHP